MCYIALVRWKELQNKRDLKIQNRVQGMVVKLCLANSSSVMLAINVWMRSSSTSPERAIIGNM